MVTVEHQQEKGNKMQKRYMNNTLAKLHQKFKIELPEVKRSYTEFTKISPF